MVALEKAYLLALCLSATAKLTEPVFIVGDTDRNGVYDARDLNGRDKYSDKSGAIFMANIGDATGECAKQALQSSDEEMRKCNDARGEIQRNPKYLARLKIYPLKNAPKGTIGTIKLSPRNQYKDYVKDNVRVFKLVGDETSGDGWKFVSPETEFTADELNNGIELGVDARSFIENDRWDGYATVTLFVTEGGTKEVSSDKVELRVAPLLIHHNLQKLEQVFTVSGKKIEAKNPIEEFRKEKQEKFAEEIVKYTSAETHGKVVTLDDADRWVQDWFESGYTSMPGKDGPVVLRVMIRSSRTSNSPDQKQDRRVFTEMRSDSTGAIQVPLPDTVSEAVRKEFNNLEAMGNLELIPPYRDTKNKVYENGRILMGTADNGDDIYFPNLFQYLGAQGTSGVDVDLSWTASRHIDEIVQVLPADNSVGFVLAVADAESGMQLLLAKGATSVAMPHPEATRKGLGDPISVGELVADQNLIAFNKLVAEKIDGLIERLIEDTNLPREYIIRVPTPFFQAFPQSQATSWNIFHGHPRTPPIKPNALYASPLYANVINGMVVNQKSYLYPKPWGPEVGGKDIFQTRFEEILAPLNIKGQDMDTWFSHHVDRGELHCGTNALRDASQMWWLPLEERQAQANKLRPT